MNYVSKQNAEGLKEIGFDGKTFCWRELYREQIQLSHDRNARNWNQIEHCVSVPDFLTAADWLHEKHGIGIAFHSTSTVVTCEELYDALFNSEDHRNAALAHAIQIVKRRK